MNARSIARQIEIDRVAACLAANGAPEGTVDLSFLGTVDDCLNACKRLFPDWWRHQIVSLVRCCTGATPSTVNTRMSKLGMTGTWKVRERWNKPLDSSSTT